MKQRTSSKKTHNVSTKKDATAPSEQAQDLANQEPQSFSEAWAQAQKVTEDNRVLREAERVKWQQQREKEIARYKEEEASGKFGMYGTARLHVEAMHAVHHPVGFASDAQPAPVAPLTLLRKGQGGGVVGSAVISAPSGGHWHIKDVVLRLHTVAWRRIAKSSTENSPVWDRLPLGTVDVTSSFKTRPKREFDINGEETLAFEVPRRSFVVLPTFESAHMCITHELEVTLSAGLSAMLSRPIRAVKSVAVAVVDRPLHKPLNASERPHVTAELETGESATLELCSAAQDVLPRGVPLRGSLSIARPDKGRRVLSKVVVAVVQTETCTGAAEKTKDSPPPPKAASKSSSSSSSTTTSSSSSSSSSPGSVEVCETRCCAIDAWVRDPDDTTSSLTVDVKMPLPWDAMIAPHISLPAATGEGGRKVEVRHHLELTCVMDDKGSGATDAVTKLLPIIIGYTGPPEHAKPFGELHGREWYSLPEDNTCADEEEMRSNLYKECRNFAILLAGAAVLFYAQTRFLV